MLDDALERRIDLTRREVHSLLGYVERLGALAIEERDKAIAVGGLEGAKSEIAALRSRIAVLERDLGHARGECRHLQELWDNAGMVEDERDEALIRIATAMGRLRLAHGGDYAPIIAALEGCTSPTDIKQGETP